MSDMDFRLYLITDRKQVSEQNLVSAVRKALEGGVRAVQIREKDFSDRKIYELGTALRALTREYGAKLFINDRADLARVVEADGVHLTQSSYSARDARKIIGDAGIIGVSTHSLEQAKEAEEEGADFITLGPIYETPSKLRYGPPVGIALLEQVVQSVGIPVFAIGGMRRGNAPSVIDAGAHGVALISGILAAPDIKKEAREYMTLIHGKGKSFSRV